MRDDFPMNVKEAAFIERFSGHFRDECLNENEFEDLAEARQIIEGWRRNYNALRPHEARKRNARGVR